MVLIETYWNVKMIYAITEAPAIIVLIETYWNVKAHSQRLIRHPCHRINRNILECKAENRVGTTKDGVTY